jgi:hypothetical protein
MALEMIKTYPRNGSTSQENDDHWKTQIIDEADHELAREVGIQNPIIDDYDTMVNNQEDLRDEFFDEYDNFKLEEERTYADFGYITAEVLDTNKVQENIEVRIIKKWHDNFNRTKWALGSIDGNKNVYISKSLANKVTVGELVRMNLVYKPSNNNIWKAIYVYQKVEPVIVEEMCTLYKFNNYSATYHIPKQDIGKMIGKNGFYIKKVFKNLSYDRGYELDKLNQNYEKFSDTDEWWNSSVIPSLDINNPPNKNYTEVTIWYDQTLPHQFGMSFNAIQDLVMKLYN